MRGIHLREGYASIDRIDTFEVNFGPAFVVAKGSITQCQEGRGCFVWIIERRERPDPRGPERRVKLNPTSYTWGPNISSVTFQLGAFSREGRWSSIEAVLEIQFW